MPSRPYIVRLQMINMLTVDIVKTLEIKALPYVLFLIVPTLGRMSDPDEQVRLLSTSTFAALVKMVPLEAGIPDPPGFSAELLAKRDDERKFLMQLLDGSKAEQYQVPIDIKADLRQYQKDGVSWLAFLAKYQLHGILCDGTSTVYITADRKTWDSARVCSPSVSSDRNTTSEPRGIA